MNKNIAFVHASLAVNNQFDRPSLVMEAVGGRSLLERLLHSLNECRHLDEIVLITSDRDCDDRILSLSEMGSPGGSGPKLRTLRIPSDSPFSFRESNTILDKALLYKLPYYGLLSAEGFLSLTAEMELGVGIILDANASAFVTPGLIDLLTEKAGRYGEAMLMFAPLRGIFTATREGVEKMLSRYSSSQRDRRAAQQRTIEQELDLLRNGGQAVSVGEIERIAKRKLATISKKELSPLAYCFDQRSSEEGRRGCVSETFGNEDAMFGVMSQEDLAMVRGMFPEHSAGDLAEVKRARVERERISRRMRPSCLNIEVTNRCNAACSFCPNPGLKRARQDMEWHIYRKAIDETTDATPFVTLSGFGEPLLHPEIVRMVRYAKERGVMRLALETNGISLDEAKAGELFASGLDFLVLNMNAMISHLNDWQERVAGILAVRDEARAGRESDFPKVILHVVNTNSDARHLDGIFARFNFIADRIVIAPFSTFRGEIEYDGAIDFTPAQRTRCQKLMNTLLVLADGHIGLCGEFPEGVFEHLSFRKNGIGKIMSDERVLAMNAAHIAGRYPEECTSCRQWYMRDFVNHNKTPLRTLIHRASAAETSELATRMVRSAEEQVASSDYDDAIDTCEAILRHDPANGRAWEILRMIEERIETGAASHR